MNKTTLEQWRMFAAVVEAGGFSQASDLVHKSQSSIHYAVHKLEESLDIKLLEVVGRKAVLTDAGVTMLRRAEYLLKEASKLEQIAGSFARGNESVIRIAIDEAYPKPALKKILKTMAHEFPLLRLELMETVLNGAAELLYEGRVTMAISPVVRSDVSNEELCHVGFTAVASPNHPLAATESPLSFEDLKSHRQIVVRDSALNANMDSGWLGASQRWTVSHIKTSLEIVAEGIGFAWLPNAEIAPFIKAGSLVPLKMLEGAQRNAALYLLIADADQLGPAGKRLVELIKQNRSNF
jgi:DNA-binding transcriptional LysR family regulator